MAKLWQVAGLPSPSDDQKRWHGTRGLYGNLVKVTLIVLSASLCISPVFFFIWIFACISAGSKLRRKLSSIGRGNRGVKLVPVPLVLFLLIASCVSLWVNRSFWIGYFFIPNSDDVLLKSLYFQSTSGGFFLDYSLSFVQWVFWFVLVLFFGVYVYVLMDARKEKISVLYEKVLRSRISLIELVNSREGTGFEDGLSILEFGVNSPVIEWGYYFMSFDKASRKILVGDSFSGEYVLKDFSWVMEWGCRWDESSEVVTESELDGPKVRSTSREVISRSNYRICFVVNDLESPVMEISQGDSDEAVFWGERLKVLING